MRYSKITKLAEPLVEEGVKKVAKFFKQENGLLRLNKEAGLFTAVKADGITPIDTFMSDRAMFTQEAGLVPIKGISAKHASPHKFDYVKRRGLKKSGGKPVGEKSTDEGWGVYFYTNPGVGRFYLEQFGNPSYNVPKLMFGNKTISLDDPSTVRFGELVTEKFGRGQFDLDVPSLVKERMSEIDWSISQMTKRRADLVEATKEAERRYMTEVDDALKQRAFNQFDEGERQLRDIDRSLQYSKDEKVWLQSIPPDSKIEGGPSSYSAELLAKDDELLNWYEPLGDQIKRNPKLKKIGDAVAGMSSLGKYFGFVDDPDYTGRVLYNDLKVRLSSRSRIKGNKVPEKMGERLASLWLDKHGIKGIKYEDSGSVALPLSRKTYNYVIFNPDNIKLKSRNKKALPISPREATSGLRQRYSGLGTITPIDQYLDEAKSMRELMGR